jgi:hypothetical protein
LWRAWEANRRFPIGRAWDFVRLASFGCGFAALCLGVDPLHRFNAATLQRFNAS